MGLFSLFKKKRQEDNKALEKANKYKLGMSKTRNGLMNKLKGLFTSYDEITEELFDDLTDIFIMADIGVETTLDFIEELKEDERVEGIQTPEELHPIIVDKMFELYLKNEIVDTSLNLKEDDLSVLLFVGVNGVGKTTTIAKLAHRYIKQGKKVLLGAADTFRAGAVDQLKIWAQRLNCDIVTGLENGDPASVAYDTVHQGIKNNVDLIIIDTAGRLQNKSNLMDELSKIRRVIGKEIPDAPHDVFLVIDATTGQNGVIQAKGFADATGLTGIVVTKMDGTSKGGIILGIRDELGIPVRFIGLGEQMDDLQEFDLDEYLYGLCLGGEE